MWTFLRKKMKKRKGTFVVASASEYLAITGAGIGDDVKLAKTWLVRPGKHCNRFSISPWNYVFDVRAMSADKVTVRLPTVLTIGPKICAATGDLCCEDPLHLYARLIAPLPSGESHVQGLIEDVVGSVVKGEIRELAAELAMEEILKGAQEFKNWVLEKVQLELNQFGLVVYNANVKPPVHEH